MAERKGVYFVSDVHLGLKVGDPAEREARFVRFLREIPRDTTLAVYLLGDIWDFWYEYRDVVPREGALVVAELVSLMKDGVQVHFCEGNHDIWTFSFFEELGMEKFRQPCLVNILGSDFCLGHGDGIGGGAGAGYNLLQKIFRCRFAQKCFNVLHPRLAFGFANAWSGSARKQRAPYHFEPEKEPLFRFVREQAASAHVDYFIFGHYHDSVDVSLPEGGRFILLKDWIGGGTPHAFFDGEEVKVIPAA